MGGEVLVTPWSEILQIAQLNAIYRNKVQHQYRELISIEVLYQVLKQWEAYYQRMASPVLGDDYFLIARDIIHQVRQLSLHNEVGGETLVNIAKILHYLKTFQPEAVIHCNPLFCCQ